MIGNITVSYAGKNAYSASKTSGGIKGGASRANRCYVLAHCGGRGGGGGTVGEHIAPISFRGINLKRALVLQGPCKVLQGVPTENISKKK